MSKIKTQILDKDPNSIFEASKKLSDIAVTNMKNISQNDAIPTPLDSILKPSSTTILPQRLLPLIPSVNTTVMTKANTYVDEFLAMITETNTVLVSLNLLVENYANSNNGEEEEEEGASLPKYMRGGAEDDNDRKMTHEEQEAYDNNHRPDDKDMIDASMTTDQIETQIDDLNEYIHIEEQNVKASEKYVKGYLK